MERAIRIHRGHGEREIEWEAVREKGTGFFGRPTPEYFEAREAAWSKMDAPISEAVKLGADRDFLRACTLHLAELAAWSDDSPESFRLQQGTPEIVLSRRREAYRLVEEIRVKAQRLRSDWNKAKGMVEPDDPQLPGEEKVDSAFSNLDTALDGYLQFYGPGGTRQKHVGRPPSDDILRVLSGMDKHIEVKTKKVRHPLLFKLTSILFHRLPIARTANQLRAGIHTYRRREKSAGDAELQALIKEYGIFRNKFRPSGGIYNA